MLFYQRPEADIYIGYPAGDPERGATKHVFPVFDYSYSRREITVLILEEDFNLVKAGGTLRVAVDDNPPLSDAVSLERDVKVISIEPQSLASGASRAVPSKIVSISRALRERANLVTN